MWNTLYIHNVNWLLLLLENCYEKLGQSKAWQDNAAQDTLRYILLSYFVFVLFQRAHFLLLPWMILTCILLPLFVTAICAGWKFIGSYQISITCCTLQISVKWTYLWMPCWVTFCNIFNIFCCNEMLNSIKVLAKRCQYIYIYNNHGRCSVRTARLHHSHARLIKYSALTMANFHTIF